MTKDSPRKKSELCYEILSMNLFIYFLLGKIDIGKMLLHNITQKSTCVNL